MHTVHIPSLTWAVAVKGALQIRGDAALDVQHLIILLLQVVPEHLLVLLQRPGRALWLLLWSVHPASFAMLNMGM